MWRYYYYGTVFHLRRTGKGLLKEDLCTTSAATLDDGPPTGNPSSIRWAIGTARALLRPGGVARVRAESCRTPSLECATTIARFHQNGGLFPEGGLITMPAVALLRLSAGCVRRQRFPHVICIDRELEVWRPIRLTLNDRYGTRRIRNPRCSTRTALSWSDGRMRRRHRPNLERCLG